MEFKQFVMLPEYIIIVVLLVVVVAAIIIDTFVSVKKGINTHEE